MHSHDGGWDPFRDPKISTFWLHTSRLTSRSPYRRIWRHRGKKKGRFLKISFTTSESLPNLIRTFLIEWSWSRDQKPALSGPKTRLKCWDSAGIHHSDFFCRNGRHFLSSNIIRTCLIEWSGFCDQKPALAGRKIMFKFWIQLKNHQSGGGSRLGEVNSLP